MVKQTRNNKKELGPFCFLVICQVIKTNLTLNRFYIHLSPSPPSKKINLYQPNKTKISKDTKQASHYYCSILSTDLKFHELIGR